MAPRLGLVKPLLLALALLLVAACAPAIALPATSRTPTSTPTTVSTRTQADALTHIHNASAHNLPLSATVIFTADTTYDQATAILQGHVYPWTCDEPRSNVPPPLAEQLANFAKWHSLNMFYPAWDELVRIASSPQVVSVEGGALYPCP